MHTFIQATPAAPDSVTLIGFLADFVKFWQIIVFVFGAYQFWASRRERLASDKVREAQELLDSNYQAWLVVNSAQGKGESGGRIDALTNLARNSQSLAGVNADGAWLVGVDLRGADLAHANLEGTSLQGARAAGAAWVSGVGGRAGRRGEHTKQRRRVGGELLNPVPRSTSITGSVVVTRL